MHFATMIQKNKMAASSHGFSPNDHNQTIEISDYNKIQMMTHEEREQWLDSLTVDQAKAEEWNLKLLDLVLNTHKIQNQKLKDFLS